MNHLKLFTARFFNSIVSITDYDVILIDEILNTVEYYFIVERERECKE
jgi:hypothetical protein